MDGYNLQDGITKTLGEENKKKSEIDLIFNDFSLYYLSIYNSICEKFDQGLLYVSLNGFFVFVF